MFNKKYLAYALIAIAFGATGAWVGLHKNAAQPPLTMTAAPHQTGPADALLRETMADARGTRQALAQWKGKALVVNFWAPWCAPCVEEMPELSALQGQLGGKNVQVIGIGIDTPDNIATFAAKHHIAYPVYVAGMRGTDLSRMLGNAQGGLPFTVLIGADGAVRKTYLGRLKFDQLRADLATL